MMMKRVLLRVTPTKKYIKDLEGYPEIDEIIDNSDERRAANSYDQYIGDEVVLPDRKGEKLMGKIREHVRYDDTSISKDNYNIIYDKSLYEVEYPYGTMEQLAANIRS